MTYDITQEPWIPVETVDGEKTYVSSTREHLWCICESSLVVRRGKVEHAKYGMHSKYRPHMRGGETLQKQL